MKLLSVCAVAALAAQAAGVAISHKLNGMTIREHPDPEKRALLQKYVSGLIILRDLSSFIFKLLTSIARSLGMRSRSSSMASD